MKKSILSIAVLLALVGCQESLEDRAERESREFTQKNCPYAIDQSRTLDSLLFDKKSKTFCQYETIQGVGDDSAHFNKIQGQLHEALVQELHIDTQKRTFKQAGYSYRYVMRSKSDGHILFDTTITQEEYQ